MFNAAGRQMPGPPPFFFFPFFPESAHLDDDRVAAERRDKERRVRTPTDVSSKHLVGEHKREDGEKFDNAKKKKKNHLEPN